MRLLATGYGDLGELFIRAGNDPFLLVDSDWQLQTAIALAGIQLGAEGLEGLQAAPGTEDIHRNLREVASRSGNVVRLVTYGIDHLDVPSFERATDDITKVNRLLVEMTQSIDNFCR